VGKRTETEQVIQILDYKARDSMYLTEKQSTISGGWKLEAGVVAE
jgi:hypothetical protein